MRFKVAARTVLELGAELISSDAIAIYELVKNAFDAKSPDVEVSFRVLLKRSAYEQILVAIEDGRIRTVEGALREVKHHLLTSEADSHTRTFLKSLSSTNLRSFVEKLSRAYEADNIIYVVDRGSGMSSQILEDAFLTIGTSYRLEKRNQGGNGRAVLGEKGVGRLSAMRLGSHLTVATTQAGEDAWRVLDIDWNDFSRDPQRMLDEVELTLSEGTTKKRPSSQGTRLTIADLSSDWDLAKLKEITASEFSRLSDPFVSADHGFPMKLSFNDVEVKTEHISRKLFDAAHGYCSGVFDFNNGHPRLTADFEYRLYSEKQHFDFGEFELRDFIAKRAPESALKTLGPFRFEFYWFNRQLLRAIDSIGTLKAVRDLVNHWTGGLMLFRDGFRVNPYGNKGDDWLDLNAQAFKSRGYLLNTDQIVGRIEITHLGNPRLVDQTNREGLRDNFEKAALMAILRHFITVPLKKWIDSVVDDYKGLAAVDLDDIAAKVEGYDRRVQTNVKTLKSIFPGQTEVVDRLVDSFSGMKLAFTRAHGSAQKAEEDRQRMIELAGVGLMVEVVAHELARATKHTLDLVKQSQKGVPEQTKVIFRNLEAQLLTIEKRLRVLDPLSVSGRNRKAAFDLRQLVEDTLDSRADELRQKGISWAIKPTVSRLVRVQAVRGMIVQILENLLSNSIHWLGVEERNNSRFEPAITVEVSPEHGGSISVTDNGRGVAPQFREAIFEAFYTTRADEGGRGLGLYIAKENARYHGGDLNLTSEHRIHPDRLNTFQFDMDVNA